jgi:hypothetical protein
MPSARELLAQADALMRRNRARAVDTEIPELTEIVTEMVPAPRTATLDEVPELTDAVEEIEIASIAEIPDDAGEPSAWMQFDREPVRPVKESGPLARSEDWTRWEALGDEVRMQVLQRVDLFTDVNLREQLSAHLQPIVDRAGAELVATLSTEVGRLLRAYIAVAIEREIDKRRSGADRP